MSLKINLGCGDNPIPGYVNVDAVNFPGVDVVTDIVTYLNQLEPHVCDEILMSHVIEHFPSSAHLAIFARIAWVLKQDGILRLAFPDAEVSMRLFLENRRGQSDFWEATIFGRGLTTWDQHRSLCTRKIVSAKLLLAGFDFISTEYEDPPNECNLKIVAKKKFNFASYEEALGANI